MSVVVSQAKLPLAARVAGVIAGSVLAIGVSGAPSVAAVQGDQVDRLQKSVVFDVSTPLSRNTEMARRLLTPLTVSRLRDGLVKAGKSLTEQPIDLSRETFLVYTPATKPPAGYGLIVFIPPWNNAELPSGWAEVLDRYGLIFVTAAGSGNEQSILGRREPLALAAAGNILRRYPIDDERVYVAGLSGGSRVAMRLALGYPDLFRGAFLNAGSDPIGSLDIPLPPEALLRQLQSATRLVFATGANDEINLNKDAESRLSFQAWCVFDLDEQVAPGVGHEVASPAALAYALGALQKPRTPDLARIDRCWAARQAELKAKLGRVDALKAKGGDLDAVRRLQGEIDARYGNLTIAAP